MMQRPDTMQRLGRHLLRDRRPVIAINARSIGAAGCPDHPTRSIES